MIECTKFVKHENGNLLGYADLFVTKWGLDIKGCTLHAKGEARWINFPCKEFINSQKEKIYVPIISFREKAHMEAFKEEAKKAIDEFNSN